ncbi:CGNR zinc finger domain-containing protein [Streptomyces sp. NPDC001985]|uniref:CGNR zinc finger domain-containing protein n=1 Tax=Streptomyces sp. NPDC001985 TaxID=3154406 RepID=UPI00331CC0AC
MVTGATGTAPHDWRFDSGRLCLDLMATGESAGREPLAGPGRLAHWLLTAGLLPAGTPVSAVDGPWVGRFVELRGWINQVVRAEIDGRYAPTALERVNAAASGPPPPIRAVRDDTSGALVMVLGTAPECGALLAAVARDAVELLTDSVARGGLRECSGEGCRRVYLDSSRGRRRRWCSSEVCGNRERVARHRRRTASMTRA